MSQQLISTNELSTTGVTAATYANSAYVPVITVDTSGRISSVTNTAISIPTTAVTGTFGFSSGGTNATSYTTGTVLVSNGTAIVSLANTGTAGTYGNAAYVPVITTDAYGRVSAVTNTAITLTQLNDNLNASSKIISYPIFKDYALAINALGNISGATTIDLSLGNYITATVTGTVTWTFSNPPTANAAGFVLKLTNGGSATQNWPSSVTKWPSGTAPTLTTSGTDLLVFLTDDTGSTWRGTASMTDSR
jgi:hypothetical protein